jgi:GTPase
MSEGTKAGLIAVVGRPNVGKSSLVNALVGDKVSIVTAKPQTTRHRAMGVLTQGDRQYIFVDTPGIHRNTPRRMNREMNRAAAAALNDADVVLFVVEAGRWNEEDQMVLDLIGKARVPAGLVIAKVDTLPDRARLLPFVEGLASRHDWEFVVPLSAKRRENLEALLAELGSRLPESPLLFPSDQVSDQSEAMQVAEAVREKLTLRVHRELPYAVAVQVEKLEREEGVLRAEVTIWVEREGQKAIVIGEGGRVLRDIGTAARKELEARYGLRVWLGLWVKVREGWPDDRRQLSRMGLSPE